MVLIIINHLRHRISFVTCRGVDRFQFYFVRSLSGECVNDRCCISKRKVEHYAVVKIPDELNSILAEILKANRIRMTYIVKSGYGEVQVVCLEGRMNQRRDANGQCIRL